MPTSRSELALLGGPPLATGQALGRWPETTAEDRAAIQRVQDRGVYGGEGAPEARAIEREYARAAGVSHCLMLNNGTAALESAAAALGLGAGDEVIVPAYTFIASAMAMLPVGARVVFADVDPLTYNLAVDRMTERLTPRTRAVVAVSIHGQPPDFDEIADAAPTIPLIEDDAQAHGTEYRGRRVGGIGACGAFSCADTKNLPAGEGGMLTTNDPGLFHAAQRRGLFGEDRHPLSQRPFWAWSQGQNYRPTEFTCALARSRLARLPLYNSTANVNAGVMTAQLKEVRGITPPLLKPDRTSAWWKYAVQLHPSAFGFHGDERDFRDRVLRALKAEGVPAHVWQPHPVPAQPAMRAQPARFESQTGLVPWDPAEYPVATRLCNTTVHLGTERHPLYVQTPEIVALWSQGLIKVLEHIEHFIDRPLDGPPPPRMI